jgi:hypothetical protein
LCWRERRQERFVRWVVEYKLVRFFDEFYLFRTSGLKAVLSSFSLPASLVFWLLLNVGCFGFMLVIYFVSVHIIFMNEIIFSNSNRRRYYLVWRISWICWNSYASLCFISPASIFRIQQRLLLSYICRSTIHRKRLETSIVNLIWSSMIFFIFVYVIN